MSRKTKHCAEIAASCQPCRENCEENLETLACNRCLRRDAMISLHVAGCKKCRDIVERATVAFWRAYHADQRPI